MLDLIYTACMCAVLGAGVKMLSPAKMQREMRLICTLMLVVCTAARAHGGFSLDISELVPNDTSRTSEYGEHVLADTEYALGQRLDERLAELGINAAETGIVCGFDEYNYVRAEKVFIVVGGEDEVQPARAAAKELFGDCETEVTVVDGNAQTTAYR